MKKGSPALFWHNDHMYTIHHEDQEGFDVIRKSDGKRIAENVKSYGWSYSKGRARTNDYNELHINRFIDKVFLLTRK